MRIVKELTPDEVNALRRTSCRANKPELVELVLEEPHCFQVEVYPEDAEQIWVRSCHVPGPPHHRLIAAVGFVQSCPRFLKEKREHMLDGQQVACYLRQLASWDGCLLDWFRQSGDYFLIDRRDTDCRIDVADGMHRLVAYGVATGLEQNHFPVPLYLGSKRDADSMEMALE